MRHDLAGTIRDLHRRRGRERRGQTLAEGVRLVEELLAVGLRAEGVAVGPALLATPRGRALRAKLVPLAIQANRRAVRGLSAADVETARRVLVAVTENLRNR